jgi:aspartate/methionine/tyrosine aminotransferase
MLYGPIRGSSELRKNIARLYSTKDLAPLPVENVLVTPGAILANFAFLYTMVGPGDHVVCMYPTYQQLYSVPESMGAEVSLWKLKEENKWIPDVDDLKGLMKPNTKLIIAKYVYILSLNSQVSPTKCVSMSD